MATIIEHQCDACKKKVRGLQDLYIATIMDTIEYQISGTVDTVSKELCIDCFYEFSINSLEVVFGTKKWLEKNC